MLTLTICIFALVFYLVIWVIGNWVINKGIDKGVDTCAKAGKKLSKNKGRIGVYACYIVLAIIFALILLFWIGACAGNFLNADENLSPSIFKFPSL